MLLCIHATRLAPTADPSSARLQQRTVLMCSHDVPPAKPLSPLAMAAAEMLEEEREEERRRAADEDEDDDDELAAYWERYDEGIDRTALLELEMQGVSADCEPLPRDKQARTQALLARYYAKFGIDKAVEDQYRDAMEAAIAVSQSELEKGQVTAALMELRQLLPYVQSNSRLGSAFLLALASAHEHAGEEKAAREIYESLANDHPQKDVRREARGLLSSVKSRTLRLSRAVDGTGSWFGLGNPFDAWRGGSF